MHSVLVVCVLVAAAIASPLPESNLAVFSDAIARNKFLPLSSAAYSSNPQTCLTKIFGDAKLQRQVNVRCDAFKNDICSGYTAVLNSEQAIVVSFRGTQGFFQLVEEANKSVFESQNKWFAGGKVSAYFGDAFTNIWKSGMKDDFATLRAKYPNYKVYVTGHSLGGSIASLAASFIIGSNLAPAANVILYTFGQPRTGNTAFAAAHDVQIPNSFRVTHWRDVVPHIPNEGYLGYQHHKTEVFYHSSMAPGAKFTICSDKEESNNCSNGLWITTSITDHLHYYEKDISAYGEKGCK